MKIELRHTSTVERKLTGEVILLNGKPIPSRPSERTFVDADECSIQRDVMGNILLVDDEPVPVEPCSAEYCEEYSICPTCERGCREFGEVNLLAAVAVFRLPCGTILHSAICQEVVKLVKDQFDVTLKRIGGVPTELIDKAMVQRELNAEEEDEEPESKTTEREIKLE